jgi:hypothetical protein
MRIVLGLMGVGFNYFALWLTAIHHNGWGIISSLFGYEYDCVCK